MARISTKKAAALVCGATLALSLGWAARGFFVQAASDVCRLVSSTAEAYKELYHGAKAVGAFVSLVYQAGSLQAEWMKKDSAAFQLDLDRAYRAMGLPVRGDTFLIQGSPDDPRPQP